MNKPWQFHVEVYRDGRYITGSSGNRETEEQAIAFGEHEAQYYETECGDRDVRVKIAEQCSTCDGSGRKAIKPRGRRNAPPWMCRFVPCHTCHGEGDLRVYELDRQNKRG